MRIAVISCKKQKQKHSCIADEMYSKSYVYRAQRDFIKEAYDEYYILSSKYGIISPNNFIDPYDVSVYKNPTINFSKTKQVDDPSQFWYNVSVQIQSLLDKGGILDFHTSNDYFTPLPKEIKSKVSHIKQPKAFGLTQTVYQEAKQMFNGSNIDECLEHITKKRESKYKEQPKWFYHPEFGEYFGKTSDLHRKYPNDTDEGTLYMLSTFRAKQHKGWVLQKELLPFLKKNDKGRWSLNKKMLQ